MALTIGQPAPEFSLKNQHGELVSLATHRGKNVVLLFYPYAFSRVCSGELVEIRDNLADVQNERSALLAISCDPMFSLRTFADRDGLTFPLLSDFWPHGAVSRCYGVFNEQLAVLEGRRSSSTGRAACGGRCGTRCPRRETSVSTARCSRISAERPSLGWKPSGRIAQR